MARGRPQRAATAARTRTQAVAMHERYCRVRNAFGHGFNSWTNAGRTRSTEIGIERVVGQLLKAGKQAVLKKGTIKQEECGQSRKACEGGCRVCLRGYLVDVVLV